MARDADWHPIEHVVVGGDFDFVVVGLCDAIEHRVLRVDPSGGRPEVLIDADAGLRGPEALVVIGQRLFIADAGNHRIQVFAADGTFARAFGELGPGPGELHSPRGLVVGRLALGDQTQLIEGGGVLGLLGLGLGLLVVVLEIEDLEQQLVPDLETAFLRLLERPEKRDPGCAGKTAVAGALDTLEAEVVLAPTSSVATAVSV